MRQADLSARVQRIDEHLARLRAERSRLLARATQMQRKRETRRKIVIGAAILSAIDQEGVPRLLTAADLLTWLDTRLTRPSDRATFQFAVQEPVAVDEAARAASMTPLPRSTAASESLEPGQI